MVGFEKMIKLENLEKSREDLVPYIFSQNYFNILKAKLQDKRLTSNERYYYNHFIKKKIKGMMQLLEVDDEINGKMFIRHGRLAKARETLKKYSRKHRNMQVLVSGSFLYNEGYNDIDVFVVSKYDKDDYREGKVHVNYLPEDVEQSLFFHSMAAISVANFKIGCNVEEEIKLDDILHLYEIVVLLMMQEQEYKDELRDLVLRLEYASNGVVLNSKQLKREIDRMKNVDMVGFYVAGKIVGSYDDNLMRKVLKRFIQKNGGAKAHDNWKVYNEFYRRVLKLVGRKRDYKKTIRGHKV